MFGISHSPESDSLSFGGLMDRNNKDRLLSFLSGVNKNAEYSIYEYDVQGTPYDGGKPKILSGSDLLRISLWCSHVTHTYQIRNISGMTLCTVSFGYTRSPSTTSERVARILH